MGPHDFLRALWGDTPPGLIQTWELAGKRSAYYRAPYGTTPLAGRTDIYTGVGLAHKDLGRSKRARNEQVIAIAGLWLDLDVDGPDKTGAAPDHPTAKQAATAITAPTIVVNSGRGLHAWYLFDEPWRFTSREEQQAAALASAQWFALHRQAAGFAIDSAHDLARLMRLPGTLNGKTDRPLPVTVLLADGPRHPRATLLEVAAQAGDVAITGPAQLRLDGMPVPEIQITGIPDITRRKIDALIDNVPEFAATWQHKLGPRANAWSLSEYDLSLCAQASGADFADQELADLIRLHRAHYGDGKGERLDYLQRTIAIVRRPSERQDAAAALHARHTQTLQEAA